MTCRSYPGPHPACIRLRQVKGYKDKKNDMIFHRAIDAAKPARNLIYFPGDVQDYSERMLSHPDNRKYIQWNLETTAERLACRFPDSNVWVVKPANMQFQTYSVFSHFVQSNPTGVPTFGDGQKSWHHLKAILEDAIVQLLKLDQSDVDKKKRQIHWVVAERIMSDNVVVEVMEAAPTFDESSEMSNVWDDAPVGLLQLSAHTPLTLLGFSKGCVVLNQLLHDVTEAQNDPSVSWFLDCVDHVYWLDGGHNGGSNTWVVHDRIIDKLLNLEWHYHVHVTPYQVKDTCRNWIGIEHQSFLHKLRARKLKVESKLHFASEERSLENHFRILSAF